MIEQIKKPSPDGSFTTATDISNFNTADSICQEPSEATFERSYKLAKTINEQIFAGTPQVNIGFDTYIKNDKWVKLPVSAQGESGVAYGSSNVIEHLGQLPSISSLRDTLKLSTKKTRIKYVGMVLTANIPSTKEGNEFVVLDVDFKHAKQASAQVQAIYDWAVSNGFLMEKSHSGKGFHIFIAVKDVSRLPKKFQLDIEGAEVEIFSRHEAKPLMFTGIEVTGAFIDIPVNLVQDMAKLGININAPQKSNSTSLKVDEDVVIEVDKPKPSPLNQAALAQRDKWVLKAFPGAEKIGDARRISSELLGRDLDEDISISPKGIKDWGVWDLGDPREGRRTPTELIAEHVFGGIQKWQEAQAWLLEQIDFELNKAKATEPDKRIKNPLAKLLAMEITSEMIESMEDAQFAWRRLIVQGHLIIIVAEANGGKTTIMTFISAQLVRDGYKVIYINADASMSNLKEYANQGQRDGYVVINPDLSNVSTDEVISLLREMSKSDEDYSKTVVILDTLKKFADLMQKSKAKEFNNILRALTTKGVTVICLAHTNKYKDADGKPVFEGTGDLRNDCDELIYLIPAKNPDGTKTVTTNSDKVRAEIVDMSFKILPDRSVVVLPGVVDTAAMAKEQKSFIEDAELIEFISSRIREYSKSKPELAKLAKEAGVESNRRTVFSVVDRYCQGKANKPQWRAVKHHPNGFVYMGLSIEQEGL